MGDLVQAAQACYDASQRYKTPFISGKDSFNNEYLGPDGKRHAIPPTLLISALGWMSDWEQSITMDLKKAGNLLLLVGDFQPVFGGSHYNLVNPLQTVDEGIPACSLVNPEVYRTFYGAVTRGLVAACHDLSEGGLAVAAAEMCMAGRKGARLDLDGLVDPPRVLFGETGGCLLVEIAPAALDLFASIMGQLPWQQIGEVESNPVLHAVKDGKDSMSVSLTRMLGAWKDRQTL